MCLFFHHKNIIKRNDRNSAHFTTIYLMTILNEARVPCTILQKHVINKIKGLFNEWQKLKKKKNVFTQKASL